MMIWRRETTHFISKGEDNGLRVGNRSDESRKRGENSKLLMVGRKAIGLSSLCNSNSGKSFC